MSEEHTMKFTVAQSSKIQQIQALFSLPNPKRGISADVYKWWGVVQASDVAGNILTTYYPYLTGNAISYKERGEPKTHFLWHGANSERPSLFGAHVHANNARRIWITEGEEDAIALFSALWGYQQGGEWADVIPAVYSLPRGVDLPSMTELDKSIFACADEINVVADNDQAGSDCVAKLAMIIPPEKFKTVTLSLNDPSDMIQAGRSKELAESALFKGQSYQPTTIVEVSDLTEELDTVPEYGLNWPWKALTDYTYGIQGGKIYGLGGGVGSSKTLFVQQVTECCISQGALVGGIFLESTALEVVRVIAGIKDGKIYDRPDVAYDKKQCKETVTGIGTNLILSKDGEIDSVEQCVELVKYMVLLRKRNVIVIDPISDLVAGESSTTGNEKLNWFFKELEKVAVNEDVAIIVTSHLNPPKRGTPHEEGGHVSLVDFTGSRALMRKASVCLGSERNSRDSEGLDLFNRIVKLKGRGCNPNAPGTFHTKYQTDTGRMVATENPPESLIVNKKELDREQVSVPWEV